MARRSSKRNARYSLLTEWYTNSGKKYSAGDSLYAWYQFDKDVSLESGTQPLPDLSGNGRNLTPETANFDEIQPPTNDSPSHLSPPGFPTKSALFDNDVIEFVDPSGSDDFSFGSPSSNSDSPFSVELWIKTTAPNPTAGSQIILGKYNISANQREWLVSLNNGKPEIDLTSTLGNFQPGISATADTALETDRWYHVVITYDGSADKSGLNIYVNSVYEPGTKLRIAGGSDGMTGGGTARFSIGNVDDESTALDFVGKLAQVAIWSKELSAEEASTLYEAASGVHDFRSGISSAPARIQLRERDQVGGHYPQNLRTGDHDAQRSITSLPFDDTNTVNFLSNYATAKIHMKGNFVFGQIFDLTSSMGNVKKRFKVVATSEKPLTVVETDDIIIPVISLPKDNDGTVTQEVLRKRVAKKLVDAISNQPDLKIEAKYQPSIVERFDRQGNPLEERLERQTVVLRHKKPSTGSFAQGNLIASQKYSFLSQDNVPSDFAAVEQFSIGTTSKIQLGTLAPLDGNSSNTLISVGHTSPTIVTSGSLVPGITDANYVPLDNYVCSPFDDSRIPAFTDDDFDLQGTPKSILNGFDSKLSSKTMIKISCKSANTTGDPIFYATGAAGKAPLGTYTPAIAGKLGSGFAYWSPVKKQWEMKGIYPQDETINVFAARTDDRGRSALGFSLIPSHSIGNDLLFGDNSFQNKDTIETLRATSLPISTYGFPIASQYNATGSQEILMSEHISSPFLLEKIKVEVKGIFGVGTGSHNPTVFGKANQPPVNKTFFLLNQKTNGDFPHVTGAMRITNYREHNVPGTFSRFYSNLSSQRGLREVVAWGKLGFFEESNYVFTAGATGTEIQDLEALFEDYDHIERFSINSVPAITGTLSFNIEPKLGLSSDFIVASTVQQNDGISIKPIIQANPLGGADLQGNASGRQIASSLGDTRVVGSGSIVALTKRIRQKSEHYKVSPYLLLPKDRLIFGWQNVTSLGIDLPGRAGYTAQAQSDTLVDQIQEVNVTLFGSLIREGVEFHDTLNQNLSTNEIHETLFEKHVLDQFDVEPILALSGSTSDALFFGSFTHGTTGVRGRRASIAKGEAGTTGSLQRNIGFKGSGTYKDTLAPHLEFFLSNLNFFSSSAGSSSGVDNNVKVGTNLYRSVVLSNNPVSSSYKLLKAVGLHQLKTPTGRTFVNNLKISPASNYLVNPGGGAITKAKFLTFDTSTSGQASYKIYSGTNNFVRGVRSFGSPEIATPPSRRPTPLLGTRTEKIAISSILLSAPIVSMFGKITWGVVADKQLGLVPQSRGHRYGFMNTKPTSPKSYFRRSSYGQFRDLIEQSPETAVIGLTDIDKNEKDLEAADGPVRVRFFARNGTPDIDPLDTNSQNLSKFSTSSLPYFDGLNKERDVVRFPPPDDMDFTTISEAVSAIIDGDA